MVEKFQTHLCLRELMFSSQNCFCLYSSETGRKRLSLIIWVVTGKGTEVSRSPDCLWHDCIFGSVLVSLLEQQTATTSLCLLITNCLFDLRAKGQLWVCWALLVPCVFSFPELRQGTASDDNTLPTAKHGRARTGVKLDSILSCLVSPLVSHTYLLPCYPTISFLKADIRALGSKFFYLLAHYFGRAFLALCDLEFLIC